MMAVSSPEFERAFAPREQRWELRRGPGSQARYPCDASPQTLSTEDPASDATRPRDPYKGARGNGEVRPPPREFTH